MIINEIPKPQVYFPSSLLSIKRTRSAPVTVIIPIGERVPSGAGVEADVGGDVGAGVSPGVGFVVAGAVYTGEGISVKTGSMV